MKIRVAKAALMCYNYFYQKELEHYMNITDFKYHSQLSFSMNCSRPLELFPTERAIIMLLEKMDFRWFEVESEKKVSGRPRVVDYYTMMVIVLYGKTQGKYSCREIAALCRRDMFLMAVLDGAPPPSYVTINRFVKEHPGAIDKVFINSNNNLEALGELGKEIIFQDGTKMESRAGRYTFSWKSSTKKHLVNLLLKGAALVEEISLHYGWGIVADEFDDIPHKLKIVRAKIESSGEDYVIVRSGKGCRFTPAQRYYREVNKLLDKHADYVDILQRIGDGRNSMSKTDPDATFMRMKDDHMRNGQLKPAYNIQVMVDGNYIVGCHSSSDRTDYNTMVPALEKVNSSYAWKYSGYCADSGYDSLHNHVQLEQMGIKDYIKPQTYEQSKKAKVKKDIGRRENMEYNAEGDYYVCKAGRKLVATGTRKSKNQYGFVSILTKYACKRGCVSCPLRKACMKRSKKKYKSFEVSAELAEYRKKALENISTEFGISARVNRSIQAEGVFAQIKANLSFRRFMCFGSERTKTEWTLMCLAMNAIRLGHRMTNDLTGVPFWYEASVEAS